MSENLMDKDLSNQDLSITKIPETTNIFIYGFFSLAIAFVISITFYFLYIFSRKNFFQIYQNSKTSSKTNKKKKNEVLKKRFHPDLIPKKLDAIIVGSGMGGLTCAGLLAKAGKKVLVLEQHNIIGGCTHTFEDKGFEFDVGIHYVGNLDKGSMNRTLIDFLTQGQLEWQSLDEEYDSAVYYDSSKTSKEFVVCRGKDKYIRKLKEQFPDDVETIDKFFKLLYKAKQVGGLYLMLKILPLSLLKFLCHLRLHKLLFRGYIEISSQTLQEVLDNLTSNKQLQAVLSYSFGDYGSTPSQTSFLMHAFLYNHFLKSGGFYPVGGASEIAYRMIPSIDEAGGCVLAGVRVKEILLENGKAVGVKIEKFNEMEIFAPLIISDAGLVNTYQKMLPPAVRESYHLDSLLSDWPVGHSCLQVFVGLNGTSEDLNLPAKNFWVFKSVDVEKDMKEYLSLSCEDAADEEIPLLFVSFPSTKDKTWTERYPNKSTCAIVTFSNWEWFAGWKNTPIKRRGNNYEDVKNAFADQAWKQVIRLFPHLEDKVAYMECGSPLSHNYYINSTKGEIYGIDHTKKRFQIENSIKMRPETPVGNLYLTGQDVFTCGFIGSAIGGLITASKVLDRYLILDLIRILGEARKRKV